MGEELKPLPCLFCKSDVLSASEYVAYPRRQVSCFACGARGPAANSDHEAIAAWNRRAQPAADALTAQAQEIDALTAFEYDPPGDHPDADRVTDIWLDAAVAYELAVPPHQSGFAEWQVRMRAALRVLELGLSGITEGKP
jgi:hypothetical protein